MFNRTLYPRMGNGLVTSKAILFHCDPTPLVSEQALFRMIALQLGATKNRKKSSEERDDDDYTQRPNKR